MIAKLFASNLRILSECVILSPVVWDKWRCFLRWVSDWSGCVWWVVWICWLIAFVIELIRGGMHAYIDNHWLNAVWIEYVCYCAVGLCVVYHGRLDITCVCSVGAPRNILGFAHWIHFYNIQKHVSKDFWGGIHEFHHFPSSELQNLVQGHIAVFQLYSTMLYSYHRLNHMASPCRSTAAVDQAWLD